METFKYVAPIAGALKYSAEDTAVAIGLMANAGIKASQGGTSLRQIMMGLQGGVKLITKSVKGLKVEVENADGSMRPLHDVIVDLRSAFNDMTDAQKASSAELIAGKVGMSGLLAIVNATEADFNKLTNAVDNSTGSAKRMADTMNNTAQGQLTLLKSQLEGLGIQIGEKLLPHVNTFIEKLSKLIEWFANLNEGTQQTIVKMGLFTFAIGGALKGLGTMTIGVGSLVSATGRMVGGLGRTTTAVNGVNSATSLTAVGGVARLIKSFTKFTPIGLAVGGTIAAVSTGMKVANTHSKMLGKTVLDTTDDMSTMEKGLNSLNNMQFKSRAELEKLGLVYKEFGTNISDDFQNAVKTSQATLNEFNLYLSEINLDKIIDEDEEDDFLNRVNNICTGAIDVIKGNQREGKESLTEMFKLDDKKIDENEKLILKMLEDNSKLQIDEVNKLEKEIQAIKDKAMKDKRPLYEQEITDIQAKVQRIKEIELEALGSTQEEILFAKNEFSARMGTIDLENASAMLVEKAKIRDEEIIQLQAGYDTKLAMLDNLLQTEQAKGAEADAKKVAALTAEIEQNTKAKDTKILQQQQLYEEYLKILGEKNPQILGEINKANGEILTAEDKKAQEMLTKLTNQYSGMNKITQSGTYLMENTQTGAWQRVSVIVDQNTGKIIAANDNMYKKGGGSNTKLAQSAQDMAKAQQQAQKTVQDTVNKSGTVTVDSTGKIVKANGETVLSLNDVTTAADGTRKGIVDINGTPVEVTVNKDGTINSINAIKIALDNATKPRTITVTTKHVGSMAPSSAPPKPTGRIAVAGGEGATAPQMDTGVTRAMPIGIDTMLTSGGFYSSKTIESRNLITTHNSIQAPQQVYQSQSEGIDYNKLAQIMTSTMLQAMNNITLNANVEAKLDGNMVYKAVDKIGGNNLNITNRRLGFGRTN